MIVACVHRRACYILYAVVAQTVEHVGEDTPRIIHLRRNVLRYRTYASSPPRGIGLFWFATSTAGYVGELPGSLRIHIHATPLNP